MAQVAVGVQSPCCGSLAAAAGSKHDENLLGTCGTCKKAFTVANPHYEVPMTARAEQGKYEFKIQNKNKSVGTITVTGYHLNAVVENVQALVKDPEPAPGPVTPDDPAPPVIPPTPPSTTGKSPDGSYSPENVTKPKANGE